jgi:peptidoglycan/xylan/chitin deacetylase (PgdA/CDA1 family)
MSFMPPALELDEAMPTQVLITIDTELMLGQSAGVDDWRISYARSYEAAGVGIPYQLRVLAQYALKACFFVDPMPACVHGIEPIRRMVEPILAAGQEVQLHLHPRWAAVDGGTMTGAYELNEYGEDKQRDLIARARDLLMEAGVPEPIAFRAGSYAADDATLRAAASLGFAYDSSHNGCEHPWPSKIGLPAGQITPIRHEGITEIPVTLIDDGAVPRHLQLCAVTMGELRAAIEHAERMGLPLVNIVSHSFELANRTGTAPNRVHVRRFEHLCSFLSRERARFPTAFFADLHNLDLDVPSQLLPTASLRRFGRFVEQMWSNQVAERR